MSYSSVVLADSPVSYWRLGEPNNIGAAVDQQGLNNGTYLGGGSLGVTGLTGDSDTAMTLTGSGYVSLGNPAGLQLSNLTAEAWFKTSTVNAGVIVCKSRVCVLYVKNGRLYTFDYGAGNPGQLETDTGVAVSSAAHHVAITFRSGVTNGTNVYLDGTLVWTGTQSVGADQTREWEIGRSNEAATPFLTNGPFTGTLDEVAVYNTILAAGRVAAHAAGAPDKTVTGVRALASTTQGPGATYNAASYDLSAYGTSLFGGSRLGAVLIVPGRQRATPTGAGKPGQVGIGPNTAVTVAGVRVLAHTVARIGTLTGDRTRTGSRAAIVAHGRAGAVSIVYNVAFVPRVPVVAVLIDVTNNPTNPARVWTDITHWVRELQLTRDGRSNETERTQPGSLSLLLDNRDGRFNKHNTSGVYYPNLSTTRWLKVQGTWNGVSYDRWTGLVDLVSQQWPEQGADATVQLQGSSALKVLNLAPLGLAGTSYPAGLSGGRVTQIVAAAGLAAAGIDAGVASLPAYAPDPGADAKALPHLEDVEAEEQGIVFTNPSGQLVFHDRHHRFDAATVGTISDQGGLPYTEPQVADDDQFLFNSAHRVTQSGNSTGWALDSTSGTQHFVRDDTRTLLSDDGNEAQAAAEAFVLRYRDTSLRISQVQIIGAAQTASWPTILNAANSDRFLFMRSFPGAGTISEPVFLEQVSESIRPGQQWDTTWLLSPGTVDAYMSARFWRVGNSTYGRLGSFAIGW